MKNMPPSKVFWAIFFGNKKFWSKVVSVVSDVSLCTDTFELYLLLIEVFISST